jgi:hypothetical protein
MDGVVFGGLPMKRDNGERLLAYVLWSSILLAYAWSFFLPWFEFDPRNQTARAPVRANQVFRNVVNLGNEVQNQAERAPVHGNRQPVVQPESEPLTGEDAFYFIAERSQDGSFVGLAHPFLWVGLGLLAIRLWRAATLAGCLALLCAMNAILLFQPREGPWFAPRAGYYLWFLSMVLLASSSVLRNCLCSDARAVSREQLDRMAAEQQALAMQIDNLKQLTDEAVDLQAANILLEMSARGTEENRR